MIQVTRHVSLDFDFPALRRELDLEDWQPSEPGQEERSIFLGTCFAITPSGKYYTPFANGNVGACPCCGGSGEVKPRYSRRVLKRAKARNYHQRHMWIKQYGYAPAWPKHIHEASDKLNKLMRRYETQCHRCEGIGSAEAHDDEVWTEAMEAELEKYGMCLTTGEGDPCDYFASESREVVDSEEEDE